MGGYHCAADLCLSRGHNKLMVDLEVAHMSSAVTACLCSMRQRYTFVKKSELIIIELFYETWTYVNNLIQRDSRDVWSRGGRSGEQLRREEVAEGGGHGY
jgi:hypothetical protein